MEPVYFIAIGLLALAALANSVMDAISFRKASFLRRLGAWWRPEDSWRLKWKNGEPAQGERFPGSSTFLVSVTDAWHFFKMVNHACYRAAAVAVLMASTAWPWWVYAGVLIASGFFVGAVFTVAFRFFSKE